MLHLLQKSLKVTQIIKPLLMVVTHQKQDMIGKKWLQHYIVSPFWRQSKHSVKDKKLIFSIKLMQTYDESIWFSVLSTEVLPFSLIEMDLTRHSAFV